MRNGEKYVVQDKDKDNIIATLEKVYDVCDHDDYLLNVYVCDQAGVKAPMYGSADRMVLKPKSNGIGAKIYWYWSPNLMVLESKSNGIGAKI